MILAGEKHCGVELAGLEHDPVEEAPPKVCAQHSLEVGHSSSVDLDLELGKPGLYPAIG